MGVLNFPGRLLTVEQDQDGEQELDDSGLEYGWYDGLQDGLDHLSAFAPGHGAQRSCRHRRNRQSTNNNNKAYTLHEFKRGKGVRHQRRCDHLCSIMTMLGELSIEETAPEDWYDTGMSVWGKLAEDPHKMEVWNDFIKMSEEEQKSLLERNSTRQGSEKHQRKTSKSKTTDSSS